jgi:DNA primase catalytic core
MTSECVGAAPAGEPPTTADEPGTVVEPVPEPGTSVERILQLTEAAMRFYEERYPGSPAAAYLHTRLHTNLLDDPRFRVGHAPNAWSPLTDHLRAAGATDDELLDAGLASYTRRGQLIDHFRDRVLFPILDAESRPVGLVGRALPGSTDPRKYLNTPTTAAYRKGEHLYGLTETKLEQDAGAALCRVEGPLDALAITLAGDGHTVGVAPLGTALTDTQANLLASSGRRVMHCTDDDPAGHQAALTDYRKLTARGCYPDALVLRDAKDPAELLARHRGTHLLAATANDPQADLATVVNQQLLDRLLPRHDPTPYERIHALRSAAALIAALPPSSVARPRGPARRTPWPRRRRRGGTPGDRGLCQPLGAHPRDPHRPATALSRRRPGRRPRHTEGTAQRPRDLRSRSSPRRPAHNASRSTPRHNHPDERVPGHKGGAVAIADTPATVRAAMTKQMRAAATRLATALAVSHLALRPAAGLFLLVPRVGLAWRADMGVLPRPAAGARRSSPKPRPQLALR